MNFDELFEDKGIKYAKVAEHLNMSTNNLWKMRKDVQRINFRYMKEFAQVLDLDVDEVYEAIKETDKQRKGG